MQNIIENEQLANMYVASLHIKEAATLLQHEHPELSLTMFNLIKILIDQSGILSSQLETLENYCNE